MKSYPVRQQKQALSKPEQDEVAPLAPSSLPSLFGGNAFISFRYSSTEISAQGDKTVIKSKKASYENGKLSSESFEGSLDRNVHEQMVDQAQGLMRAQANMFLNSFAPLWPFRKTLPPNKD
jgi:hypothetical protein